MNEIWINIYNTVITTATESIDWLTICLTIIGLLIAYYGLLYNRPRIEIEPKFGIYDLKENLKYVKLLFHNIGTLTAFNIEFKNMNNEVKYFLYPEGWQKYEKISELFYSIDKIADNTPYNHYTGTRDYNENDKLEIERLNKIVQYIDESINYRMPNVLNETDQKIRKNEEILEKIRERELSINSFFETKINMLLPNTHKINHFTDFATNRPEEFFNLEKLDIEISYHDIRKMDIIGIIFFSFFKIFKITKIIPNKIIKNSPITINFIKKEITIKRIEIKTVYFKENVNSEDFMIQQKINREKYQKYVIDEFDKILNSFKFQNWFSTLNQIEKQKMTDIIYECKNDIRLYVKAYYDLKNKVFKKKNLDEKHKIFISKYVKFIKILEDLPFLTDEYKKEKTSYLIYMYEKDQEEIDRNKKK
jgi:hypothetical protein